MSQRVIYITEFDMDRLLALIEGMRGKVIPNPKQILIYWNGNFTGRSWLSRRMYPMML